MTALTCGQDTDRAHTPAVGSRLSSASLGGDLGVAVSTRKSDPSRHKGKHNATEATGQRDDRNATTAAGG